jgi:hypothetical protein
VSICYTDCSCQGVVYKYKLKALVVGSNILYYDDVICLFVFFCVARAIFQLSGDCL